MREAWSHRLCFRPARPWRDGDARVRGVLVSAHRTRPRNGALSASAGAQTSTGAEALDALADALWTRLEPRVRAACAAARDDEAHLMTPRDTPSRRATMEACRRGEIDGARKVHRKWTFTVGAWRRYVDQSGEAPALGRQAKTTVEEDPLDTMRRELGFVPRGRTRGAK